MGATIIDMVSKIQLFKPKESSVLRLISSADVHVGLAGKRRHLSQHEEAVENGTPSAELWHTIPW